MKQWVITDIHGCVKTFEALLQRIGFNRSDALYLLGDYVDRGPDSKGVLELVMQLSQSKHKVHCLLGNHEIMMLHAVHNSGTKAARHWKKYVGGGETLRSFRAVKPHEISEHYIEFIANMDHYFEVGNYILVHAGLNFAVPDPLQDKEAMLWTRGQTHINHAWLNGRIVVHGHTPQPTQQVIQNVERMEQNPVVDIDCGCVYPRNNMHHLCALELISRQLVFQKNVD
ncbi:metallophosphoesterase family protein [Tunicatimonas pelagia]|uniref:metallophosphoesterase family protein n=1 Tax=Tunicatimonas pelagia TaxID=931531 RepID=UPI002665D13E|nr:metallophosphoesterase family protein [Tunicatimonas pelagia]WKN41373.1 metallophosphoesterase family protein [Tunicatimonas pelagia]